MQLPGSQWVTGKRQAIVFKQCIYYWHHWHSDILWPAEDWHIST